MDRETVVFAAQMAEAVERFPDLLRLVHQLVKFPQSLTEKERNLISIAYKQVSAPLRKMLRSLVSEENMQLEKRRQRKERLITVRKHIEIIKEQFKQLCNEAIDMAHSQLDKLLQKQSDAKGQVFYLQMKADFYRYQLEFDSENFSELTQLTNKCYDEAVQVCKNAKQIPFSDPILLSLMLNFSVYQYNDLQAKALAIETAESTFQKAVEALDKLNEERYQQALLILEIIKENYDQWCKEQNQKVI